MSTPAGWYDDGSGRQRWWDGQQWTEHYAPATPAEAQAPSVPAVPPVPQAPEVPEAVAPAVPPYAAPVQQAAPATSAYAAVPGYGAAAGYPAASGYTAATPPASGPSIVGWIALGAAVLGFITACIPPIMPVGWVLLFVAFVLSIVAFFLRGKKWAPIVAIALSVVGAIVGGIVAFIVFTAAFVSAIDDYEPSVPAPSATSETDEDFSDDTSASGERPSADEVAAGLSVIFGAQGAGGYDDTIITCLSEEMVGNPDMSDETLTVIASGDSEFSDQTVALEFTTGLGDAITVCAPELQ